MTSTAPRTHRIDCRALPFDLVRGLEVIEGPDRGRRFHLSDAPTLVGSAEDAGVRLKDSAVSRRHAEVRLARGQLVVRDLDSLNGVYVDGQRILHGFVAPEAHVRLGRTVLRPWRSTERAAPDRGGLSRLVAHSRAMRELAALLRMLVDRPEPVLLLGPRGAGRRRVATTLAELSGAQPALLVERTANELVRGGPPEGEDALLITGAEDLDLAHARALCARLRACGRRRWMLALDPDAGPVAADLARAAAELGAIEVAVPGLEARRDDIPQLVAELLADLGAPDFPLGPESLGRIQARPWPGHVAELKAYLHSLVAGQPAPRPRGRTERIVGANLPYKEARAQMIEAFEREYVLEVLDKSRGNITRAARAAGIDRVYLHRLMKKHGVAG